MIKCALKTLASKLCPTFVFVFVFHLYFPSCSCGVNFIPLVLDSLALWVPVKLFDSAEVICLLLTVFVISSLYF